METIRVDRSWGTLRRGSTKLIVPIVIAAVVVAGWYLWQQGGAKPNPAEQAEEVREPDPVQEAVEEAAAAESASNYLTALLTELTEALATVTDEASARAVVEKITQIRGTVDGLKLGSLTAAGKATVGGVVRPLLETVRAALEKVYQVEGVEAVIKPVVDPLLATLDSVAG